MMSVQLCRIILVLCSANLKTVRYCDQGWVILGRPLFTLSTWKTVLTLDTKPKTILIE